MQNNSGIHPKGKTILVAPAEVETKSAGGIITAVGDQVGREQMSQIYGVVVDVGDLAWLDDRPDPFSPITESNQPVPRAVVGDHVIFRRYSGEEFKGNDGIKYRIMNDRDVFATRDLP